MPGKKFFLKIGDIKSHPDLHPHPRNYPNNLMSCRRVQHPRGPAPAHHRDEQRPEHFFTSSFLPNASIAASVSTFIPRWISFGRKTKSGRNRTAAATNAKDTCKDRS
jgi:hypothetical protein